MTLPSTADALAILLLSALVLYAVLAGADFGGGVWDLFASGPRSRAQRDAIDRAIAPVWEANHVWLIFAVVILFSAFPPAFSALTTALHVPLTLMLLGIVARGSAYVFRKYGAKDDVSHARWSRVFSIASLLTPLLLGAIIATVCAGELRIVDGMPIQALSNESVSGAYLFAWLTPLSLCVGLFTLSLFAYTAAVFLAAEVTEPELSDDFRIRGLIAGVTTGGLALATALISGPMTPAFSARLFGSWWSLPLQIATAIAALTALRSLFARKHRLARVAVVLQVSLVVVGWGGAQYPYLIAPDVTVHNAATSDALLRVLAPVFWGGTLLLTPALYWLFVVFKAAPNGTRS